jgi:hypothetical protein
MEDSELFNFFKSKSNSFEEMPSNGLWEKIERNINKQQPSIFNLTNMLFTSFAFFMILTTIGIMVFKNNNKPTKNKIVITTKDTINKTNTSSRSESTTFIKNTDFKVINNDLKKPENLIIKDTLMIKNNLKTVLNNIPAKAILLSDNDKKTDSIEQKAANNKGIIKINRKLTKEEYTILVNKLKVKYKDSIVTSLIIKVIGYPNFELDVKPFQFNNITIKKDSIK